MENSIIKSKESETEFINSTANIAKRGGWTASNFLTHRNANRYLQFTPRQEINYAKGICQHLKGLNKLPTCIIACSFDKGKRLEKYGLLEWKATSIIAKNSDTNSTANP